MTAFFVSGIWDYAECIIPSVRIVSIHAHPDDAEILAAGTLALLAEAGHQIVIVSMTPGDGGSSIYSADEIATIRRREAAESAALIGAEYRCAEFRDMAIFNNDDSRRRVTELIRETRPDLVLTASPADYHCDHEATSTLVVDACFAASVPNYRTQSPALTAIPHLYFMDSIGGVDRFGVAIEPGFVADIGTTFETKRRMLAAHQSQREWLKTQHGIDDPIEIMERWSRRRGAWAGVKFGEGFRRYAGHPFPQTPLLEELLGAKAGFRVAREQQHDRQ
jgi:N-acetylglucosamine malate deacetylase 1